MDEYSDNEKITLLDCAIGAEKGTITLYDSKGDAVSSTSVAHKDKWERGSNIRFEPITVDLMPMNVLLGVYGNGVDFLNLDVEGTNLDLFNLIDDAFWQRLRLLCIEHDENIEVIKAKLAPFGFTELLRNPENLIMGKQ